MKCLSLTRVRSVPFAGEALRFGSLAWGQQFSDQVAEAARAVPKITRRP